jgi:hypothetical protein
MYLSPLKRHPSIPGLSYRPSEATGTGSGKSAPQVQATWPLAESGNVKAESRRQSSSGQGKNETLLSADHTHSALSKHEALQEGMDCVKAALEAVLRHTSSRKAAPITTLDITRGQMPGVRYLKRSTIYVLQVRADSSFGTRPKFLDRHYSIYSFHLNSVGKYECLRERLIVIPGFDWAEELMP